MRNTTCLFSTAAALQRVFITPLEHRSTQRLLRLPTTIPTTPRIRNGIITPLHRRTIVTSAPSNKRRSPRDDQITAKYIVIVNADNSLSPPQQHHAIMRKLDRSTHTLIEIQPSPSHFEPALCKIIDKKQLYAEEKMKAKNARKSAAAPTKNLEFNWAIDEGDLEHRLRRLKEFLGRGMKVGVLVAPKRRGRKATVEEAEEFLRRLRKAVGEVEGARESKAAEGEVGKDLNLFFEGVVKKEVKKEVKEEQKEVKEEKKRDVPVAGAGEV